MLKLLVFIAVDVIAFYYLWRTIVKELNMKN
ncbi:MAG: hypothetical protein EZS26_002788 [Candidatus Ordinivivax streblomastigis]|uniref:Uncharacterized protein n=1 Tax=Candidatus Ordinivivax streblomastigis TaxID=2540710 RepID=A0A5M8NW59_9BACT|nr:MAG: hypothetical protein EZS26_002788 [Candidatus Ordinivivax streblomastigis]